VHPFFLYEIHRQHMADWERKAALQRMFLEDDGVQRRERKHLLRRFALRMRRTEALTPQTALRTDSASACR
jgi:hypothetical protein